MNRETVIKGYVWHVYYHKLCVLGLIELLKDSVNTESVLAEKVILQLGNTGMKRSQGNRGTIAKGYITEV